MRRQVLLGVALLTLGLGMVASCGEKSDENKATEDSSSLLQTISEHAREKMDPAEEAPELKEGLEAAGYHITDYVEFPAQEGGTNGRMLLYADKGKKQGGLIFLKKPVGNAVLAKPAWHWHFDDLVPTAVSKQEFNEDGLWDLRVETASGETLEMIQDEMFTLMGKIRPGWLAMNGRCSPPADINSMMWHAFDGDTLTSWRSALASDGGAYLEVDTPFGIKQGTLVLRAYKEDQPSGGKVLVDGKEITTFQLEAGTREQAIDLGESAMDARSIRVQFDGVHGGGSVVALSEMEIK